MLKVIVLTCFRSPSPGNQPRLGSWFALALCTLLSFSALPMSAALFSAGEADDLGASGAASGNYLFFFPASVATNGSVQKLGLIIRTANTPYQAILGLYASDGAGGSPGTRLASTAPFTISAIGRLEIVTTNQPVIAPGNYWVAAAYSANSAESYTTVGAAGITTYYKAQTFNSNLPPTVSGLSSLTGQRWSHYAILDDALFPEIALSQPFGTDIPDGGSRFFGNLAAGTSSNLTFTVTNSGQANLVISALLLDGANAGSFTASSPAASVVAPNASTTFTVQFNSTGSGLKTAALHLTSNDPDENPFDIQLSGRSLSFTNDTDGDGLSDAAEATWASLGFDWQVSQTNLVSTFLKNANSAGLFTLAQVQALNVATPLLQKNPTNGQFKLTIGLQKATQLTNFISFPMTAPQTTINAQGQLEFLFTPPDNTALFRLQAQ